MGLEECFRRGRWQTVFFSMKNYHNVGKKRFKSKMYFLIVCCCTTILSIPRSVQYHLLFPFCVEHLEEINYISEVAQLTCARVFPSKSVMKKNYFARFASVWTVMTIVITPWYKYLEVLAALRTVWRCFNQQTTNSRRKCTFFVE